METIGKNHEILNWIKVLLFSLSVCFGNYKMRTIYLVNF